MHELLLAYYHGQIIGQTRLDKLFFQLFAPKIKNYPFNVTLDKHYILASTISMTNSSLSELDSHLKIDMSLCHMSPTILQNQKEYID